jgi:tetrahedral aminopeptidase
MNKKALSFLKELLATPTPSGSETAGQKLVADYMSAYADSVECDVHGSVHGVLNPDGAYRVMLSGHCDEIGLMVQHIDDKGFLTMSVLGGMQESLLQAERILIQGNKGVVPGVFGVKPIHLSRLKPGEKNEPPRIFELFVDIGAKNRKDAEKRVSVGDVATIDAHWIELGNGYVACRGMDDRVGAFIVADTLRLLKEKTPRVAVHAVSTVQEEVGLRGGRTSAFGVDPHLGLAVDVAFATDYPEMNPKIVGECKLGDGPVLHCGPTHNKAVVTGLQKAAKAARLKVQMQPEARGEGTEAFAMHMTRRGVAASLVSVPCRYMHSAVETVCLDDVRKCVELLARFVGDLGGKENWRNG